MKKTNMMRLAALLGLLVTMATASAAITIKQRVTSGPTKADASAFTAHVTQAQAWLVSNNEGSWLTAVRPVDVTASATVLEDGTRGRAAWRHIMVDATESDTISLAEVSVTLTSNDTPNSLGASFNFAGMTYSDLAYGIDAQGNKVTSGAATLPMKKVVFTVGYKSYQASTADQRREVSNYIYNWPSFILGSTVTAKGVTSTTPAIPRGAPALKMMNVRQTAIISRQQDGDPYSYYLFTSPSIEAPLSQWTARGTLGESGVSQPIDIPDDQRIFAILHGQVFTSAALAAEGEASSRKKPVVPETVDNNV